MAVLKLSRAVAAESANTGSKPNDQVYTSAVAIALLSFVFTLLILPPMFWHARNRNIGATVLIAWIVALLLSSFVNAIIWPSDNIDAWFNGVGLCDIEVKIQVASQVAVPAAFACILRTLAAVLDTTQTALSQTKSQKQRAVAIDILFCAGLPVLQMLCHYVVQTRRYYIYGISGCVAAYSPTWPSIPLLILPPILLTVYDTYLAALILVRFRRYRASFNDIMASRNITRSRFMRLYYLCAIYLLAGIPIQILSVCWNLKSFTGEPYSWSAVHDPQAWGEIVKVPSEGHVRYDRWVWLVMGLAIFLFFGCGKEALAMYRAALSILGFDKMFSSLRNTSTPGPRASVVSSFGSISSKAKSLFSWKSSSSTLKSDTHTTSTSGEVDIRKSTSLCVTIGPNDGGHKDNKFMEMKDWQ